jgi:hypothetical protein
MTLRRTLVWALSLLFGVACATGILFAFETTFAKFSYVNFGLLILSTGSVAFIWLDYFLKTEFLPGSN